MNAPSPSRFLPPPSGGVNLRPCPPETAAELLAERGALLARAVPAGFPSPADDFIERRIDLNEHLILHREATFFMRVEGNSMEGAGIHDGDLLVVDRAATAVSGSVVVAVVDGGFTVKRLLREGGRCRLQAAHPAYPEMEIGPERELTLWGVVRWAIHRVEAERPGGGSR
ncbi:MAG: translesion error-prone DNA polymerase V autoproteolytic subunit [Magnetococcales bacterium]|nr:translesion error-prone DNA polymerase V autoproteolytic subunit [Magnetococcales bacterium]